MEISEREWQQLWARLDITERRQGDHIERMARAEERITEAIKDVAELHGKIGEMEKSITVLTTTISKAQGGWSILLLIAGALGFMISISIDWVVGHVSGGH